VIDIIYYILVLVKCRFVKNNIISLRPNNSTILEQLAFPKHAMNLN